MKNLFFSFCMILIHGFVSAQTTENHTLPDIWNKEFRVSISLHGTRRGASTWILFTFDSCTNISSGNAPTRKKTYVMKEGDRATILKKMRELNIDSVKSEGGVKVVYDGWTETLCLGSHCIEAGPSAEINEKDELIFRAAWSYLEAFARKKTK